MILVMANTSLIYWQINDKLVNRFNGGQAMIGARIKQARLLAGMTQKGAWRRGFRRRGIIQMTAAAISKYENGKSYPTGSILACLQVA